MGWLTTLFSPQQRALGLAVRRGDTRGFLRALDSAMSGKLGVMGGFLDGTAAYVLSFTWHQLLSIYIFNLHPRPWGGGGEQASSIAMLRFAAGLCVVAGLVQHLARSSVCASLPGAETVPSMTGMLAGWAGGDTFLQLFRELRAARPELCDMPAALNGTAAAEALEAPDCTRLNLALAALVTVGSTLLITLLKPFTQSVECGSGRVVDWLEDWVESIWQLVSKAAATTVMVVWTSVLTKMELHGVEPDQGGVTTRIYIFWAISITAVGSAVATWLEAMEEYFVAEGAEATAAAAAARDGEPELGERANTARVAALEMKAKKDEALVEFSNLAQATLGWVAGCAWTDVVCDLVPTLYAKPTLHVALQNLAVTLALTAGCVLWLCLVGGGDGAISKDRAQSERAFISGAMAFFVGWGWVLVLRDTFVPFGWLIDEQVESLVARGEGAQRAAPPGASSVSAMAGRFLARDGQGATLAVLLFAPAMTVLFFLVKARLLELSRRSRGLEQTYSELSLSFADFSTKRRGAPAPPAARGYNRLSDAEAPAIAAAAAARPPAFGAAPAARPPAGKERTRTAATASAPPAVKPKRRYGLVPLSVRGFGGKKGKR
ncbi:hypothetical protein EMIHUDRAFT_440159 [Emiliania huxleyi CCMP1516]|uniref:Uncharacterized protein n=2 Tax=Emiliania huxleyi TaxID=2903 RepID=A0A0D3KRB7_EMIH1|nr:hypothetical protein EMIHUDRAFT_440159 [Emiliania huxleyi CCMP1516]EOD38302.1 hypothetical protein EMIHUDRAFT_440159 [Emiliania huxleyi CCMP1516]|eukprot:XP_005790731.1 hypothetical protein EMIHUDRAFT_440159 [Emiliania huxleyi CCMP1516]